jgi:hypothetical protein
MCGRTRLFSDVSEIKIHLWDWDVERRGFEPPVPLGWIIKRNRPYYAPFLAEIRAKRVAETVFATIRLEIIPSLSLSANNRNVGNNRAFGGARPAKTTPSFIGDCAAEGSRKIYRSL